MTETDFDVLDPYEDDGEGSYPVKIPYIGDEEEDPEERCLASKQLVLCTVTDLVTDFLFLDRKEDEELPLGEIQDMVRAGQLSIEDLVGRFREDLQSVLEY